ncbi:MAG: recombinase family protein [Eubacterium sp.]|nr:recombinase family protein [Eubacterium sp.]
MTNNIINPFEELTSLDKNRKRRVAFYGRVSTEHEAQMDALNNQLQWYDDQLEAHKNWVLHKKYIDRGITGTQAKKRPAFLEMMEDAKKGYFDLIVTREVSRFARNTVDTLSYTRELKQKYNIEVYFVIDNIWTFDGDGELRLTIMATLAQDESRKMSERVRAGQKVSRDNGVLYGTGNILGYDRVGDKYVINEEQAATVRKIFNLYLSGKTMNQIRDILTADGDKTAGGGKWTSTNISRILNKTTYCGVLAYGQTYNNGYLEQKRFNNKNKKSYMYKETELIPKIIEQEQYDRVQEIIKSRKTFIQSENHEVIIKHRERTNIWSKKLMCGCGSNVRMDTYPLINKETKEKYYMSSFRCYRQINFGSYNVRKKKGLDVSDSCGIKSAVEWKLDLATDKVLKHVFNDTKNLFDTTYNIIEENFSNDNDTIIQKRKIYEQKMLKLSSKKDRILEMRADGELSKDEFSRMKSKVEDEIRDTNAVLESLNIDETQFDRNEALEQLKERVAIYTDICNHQNDKDIRNRIIDEFVYRIINMGDDHFIYLINMSKSKSELDKTEDIKYYVTQLIGNKDNSSAEVYEDTRLSMHERSNNDTGCYSRDVSFI